MEKITDLSQTAELMSSEDYKERFIAEYAQTKIRALKLESILEKIESGDAPLCFKPSCPIDLLSYQLHQMQYYLSVLNVRAQIEEIDLPEVGI